MSRRTLVTRSHSDDKAVLLLRVSTKKQLETAIDIDPDGLSIATQRDHGTAKAAAMGVEVATEFVEPGYSAKTIDKRPVFRDLLRYLAEHPEVRYVIVYMRSRAFRNRFDAAIIESQLNKMGVRLISAKEDFGEGPHAVAMEGMLDVMNHLMNTMQGLDIQEKMRTKALNGGTLGVAKVGYVNTRVNYAGKQINTIGLDPDRAPLVRMAFELYSTGEYGLERLEATMADLGLTARARGDIPERPVSFKLLHRMLQDPYYAGWVIVDDELRPGRHEPIVTQELFDRVQDIRDMRSCRGQRDRVLQHYLKGDLFCGRCRSNDRISRFVYTEARGRNGQRYSYFLCRGRQEGVCDLPHLPADRVEEAIVEHYGTLRIPEKFRTTVHELLGQVLTDEQTSVRQMHSSMTKQLKDLDAKEERLLDLAADGTLPQTKIKDRLRKIHADRAAVQTGLAATGAELAVGVEILQRGLDLLADPWDLYRTRTDDVRRHLNKAFFERIYLDIEGIVADELQQPFADLHEAAGTRTTCENPSIWPAPRNGKSGPTLGGVLSDPVSSKTALVELPGIEPGLGCWQKRESGSDLRKYINTDHYKSRCFSAGCAQNVPTGRLLCRRLEANLEIGVDLALSDRQLPAEDSPGVATAARDLLGRHLHALELRAVLECAHYRLTPTQDAKLDRLSVRRRSADATA
ncbi:recombinase family protein [Nocardia fluminea]|uniref:recombinase family protein n=1 Tax=Nocardia fluminea TaxID=134984 RepID=UPI003662790A